MKLNLASTKLAFVLIALLLALLVLSAIVPQQDIAQDQMVDWQETLGDEYFLIETLGLDRIYYSPTFFIVLALLAINLLVGNIQRFRLVYKAEHTLLRARHLGSIIFHLSLLLTMAAIILNYAYKFDAVLAITEGQTLADAEAVYLREFKGPLCKYEYNRFNLTLDSLRYSDDTTPVRRTIASITFQAVDGEVQQSDVRIIHPMTYDNLEVHYGQRSGYSPEVQLIDSGGNDIFRSFVRMARRKDDGRIYDHDFIIVPVVDARIELEAQEDSSAPGTPYFSVSVEHSGMQIFEGDLTITDTIGLPNYQLTIPRVRRWCYLNVVESPFLELVFISFWIGLSGLAISFVPRLIVRKKA